MSVDRRLRFNFSIFPVLITILKLNFLISSEGQNFFKGEGGASHSGPGMVTALHKTTKIE